MIEELKNNKSIDIKNKNYHRILYKKILINLLDGGFTAPCFKFWCSRY